MAVISCDLRLVTDKAASVTELLVRAPKVRATGVKTVVTAPDRVPVSNGLASFTALPGPCVVTLVALDTPIATMDLLVPDAASATLVECLRAAELVDTSTRSQLEQLAAEAVRAVEAASAASASATAAQQAETNAESSASSAAEAASAAENSASSASSSKMAAATSATNAASSASAAAQSASNAKTSETNAKASETNAAGSASAASGSASAAAQSASDAQAAAQAASGVPDATASTVVKRDASARAKFADPAAAQDAATKAYVDTGLSGKADASHTHPSSAITDSDHGYTLTSVTGNGGKLVEISPNGTLEVHDNNMTNGNGNAVTNKTYVDSGGTPSEATFLIWGATWYLTKVGRTVFLSTNGTNIDTRQGWSFPIPDGYRPKYELRLPFGEGAASCKITPNGALIALADYYLPVSFSYLAA